jgi:hypothetical protein
MGPYLALAMFAGIFILLSLGYWAMLREARQRLTEWVKANRFVLDRCEMRLGFWANMRLSWRVRVTTPSGEKRDGVVKAGWSIREPVEVEWAPPGISVF